MRLFLTTVFVLCVSVAATNAQISGGIKAGLNFANQDFEAQGLSVSPDARTGFHAGVFISLMLSDNLGLQPELLYSAQGSEFEFPSISPGIPAETVENEYNYINIPILVKYQIIDLISIHAGPQIGFLASADTDGEDVKDDVKGSDFSFAFGGQVDLPMGIVGGLRYSLGLSDINDSDVDDTEINNNNFQIYVGYRLFGGN